MSSDENNSGVYVIISNIPKVFRSGVLRFFFSSFVESGGFICFHYIHRPEVEKPLNSNVNGEKKSSVTNCCVVKVVADRAQQLIETYNGQHWFDSNRETLPTCCFINVIKLSDNGSSIHGGYRYAIPKNLPIDQKELSVQEVESLKEMRPPSFMPNGNVGTTTDYLLNELRLGRLPPRVTQKLGLSVPNSQAEKIHSNGGFNYKSKKDRRKSKSKNSKPVLKPCFDSRYWNSQFPGEFSYWKDGDCREIQYPEKEEWGKYEALPHDVYGQGTLFEEKIGLKGKGGSDLFSNPYAQYWNSNERYFDTKTSDRVTYNWFYGEQGYQCAIPKHLPAHQDESSTQGAKSLLGMPPPFFMLNENVATTSSSLLGMPPPFFMLNENVATTSNHFLNEMQRSRLPPPMFHKFPRTQASECEYWEGRNFKETLYPEVAEWDQYKTLHHNVYGQSTLSGQCQNDLGNNRVRRDLEKMNLDERHENCTEVESVKSNEFAGFEKYSKGVGSKILQALGWKKGQGIGKNGNGIAEPLPNEGQHTKKGFGFITSDHPPKKKGVHGHPDDGKESDPKESALASSSNHKLKYKKEFLKGTM